MTVLAAARRLRWPVLALALVVTAAACSSGASARRASYPRFPGTPKLELYRGSQSHTVLLIGDSVMQQTGLFAQAAAAKLGLHGQVINAALSGSTPIGANGVDWQATLPALLDQLHPDIVVAHFGGHGYVEGTKVGSPAWYDALHSAILRLVDDVQSRGIALYWVVPPVMTWPKFAYINGRAPFPPEVFRKAASWYRNDLTRLRPGIRLNDWRSVLTPHETFTRKMRFPGGRIVTVRADEAHLSTTGAVIAANLVMAAIRPEWR